MNEVVLLDVGHGNSTLITHNGDVVVVDAPRAGRAGVKMWGTPATQVARSDDTLQRSEQPGAGG